MEPDIYGGLTGSIQEFGSSWNNTYRERSDTENLIRDLVSGIEPYGTAVVIASEVAELNGHLTKENYDFYYQQNLKMGLDPYEAADNAYNASTGWD